MHYRLALRLAGGVVTSAAKSGSVAALVAAIDNLAGGAEVCVFCAVTGLACDDLGQVGGLIAHPDQPGSTREVTGGVHTHVRASESLVCVSDFRASIVCVLQQRTIKVQLV